MSTLVGNIDTTRNIVVSTIRAPDGLTDAPKYHFGHNPSTTIRNIRHTLIFIEKIGLKVS